MNDSNGRKAGPTGKLTRPFARREARSLLSELKGWTLVGGKALRQELVMKDFLAAVRFIGAIARLAESQGHHPDLHLTGYRNLRIELSTHSIGGLSMDDFLLAEKIDGLHRDVKRPRAGGAPSPHRRHTP
jgi:4a-hydroxytetrahydrobiopterin dehydratase